MLNFMRLIAGIIIFVLSGFANAAEFGTADEAVAAVHKAITFFKTNGKEKTLAELNNPKGQFVDRDLYVVVHDMNGINLANPVLPKMIGKDISELKDVEGKPFIKKRLEMLKTAKSGWIDFKWPNSVTKQIENRSTYFERVNDLVFTCGVMKK